jgi:hypothetical protein
MAVWRSEQHRREHFENHRGPLRVRSIDEYDASADQTIAIGTPFTYLDRFTGEPRVGYFHRETSRFVAVDLDGVIRSHYQTDEADVSDMPLSTYQD